MTSAVSDFRRQFGAQLRERRTERGWTLSQLGQLAGITGKYVDEIELGAANASMAVQERLCRVLQWEPFAPTGVARLQATVNSREAQTSAMHMLRVLLSGLAEVIEEAVVEEIEQRQRSTPEPTSQPPTREERGLPHQANATDQLVKNLAIDLRQPYSDVLLVPDDQDETLRSMESRYVRFKLDQYGGKKSRTCKALGISYHTLTTLLEHNMNGSQPMQARVDEPSESPEETPPDHGNR